MAQELCQRHGRATGSLTLGEQGLTSFSRNRPTVPSVVKRVVWVGAAAALLLLCVSASWAAASPPREVVGDKRLNVVLILSDDERSDGMAVMTNVQHLLADHGVNFT